MEIHLDTKQGRGGGGDVIGEDVKEESKLTEEGIEIWRMKGRDLKDVVG